jgi:hypothetical protein
VSHKVVTSCSQSVSHTCSALLTSACCWASTANAIVTYVPIFKIHKLCSSLTCCSSSSRVLQACMRRARFRPGHCCNSVVTQWRHVVVGLYIRCALPRKGFTWVAFGVSSSCLVLPGNLRKTHMHLLCNTVDRLLLMAQLLCGSQCDTVSHSDVTAQQCHRISSASRACHAVLAARKCLLLC